LRVPITNRLSVKNSLDRSHCFDSACIYEEDGFAQVEANISWGVPVSLSITNSNMTILMTAIPCVLKVYTLHKITIQMTDEYGFETELHFYHILKRKKTCFHAITSMHTMNAYLNSSFGVRPHKNNMSLIKSHLQLSAHHSTAV
jgi:hypothetical protein